MMSFDSPIVDLRIARGRVWNIDEVVRRFPVGEATAPWNRRVKVSDEAWLDGFIYQGFRTHGPIFLTHLRGRFATAHFDPVRQRLFLARDWIGELPLHLLATPRGILVANTIAAIRRTAAEHYAYAYVRAFPQAHVQELDLSEADRECIALTMRPLDPQLYSDFGSLVHQADLDMGYEIDRRTAEHLRGLLFGSIDRRARTLPQPLAVLLSGGLDSFSIALAMRASGLRFDAYTLSVDGAGDDVSMAIEFARRLGATHHVIRVASEDVVRIFEQAIVASECYPLYNVYCAAGMLLMAQGLKQVGVHSAFCGEAVNEAVGDYTDWKVVDPRTGRPVVLQRINSTRLQRTEERQLLVWGHPRDKGKYNKQLGSGLAKHACSRMVKPFLAHGLKLECPYYEPQLLAHLVAIPSEVLHELGGKPGLVATVFDRELKQFGIDRSLIESCTKVRLQDASEGGRGGITSVLLGAGCDQRRAIETFNREFGATLDPELDARRLAWTGQ
jgi:asparagine synthetase B (glutamine-hydrolysing)